METIIVDNFISLYDIYKGKKLLNTEEKQDIFEGVKSVAPTLIKKEKSDNTDKIDKKMKDLTIDVSNIKLIKKPKINIGF